MFPADKLPIRVVEDSVDDLVFRDMVQRVSELPDGMNVTGLVFPV